MLWGKPYGYQLSKQYRIVPGPNTKTIDFELLMDVLKSKDPAELEKHARMFDMKYPKFLDTSAVRTPETEANMVSYSSYIRSGNSFLRKYL